MKRKSERGAVIVEFAMILPLLVILLIGIMDMSMLLYNKAVITNASREGCRVGIVSKMTTKMRPMSAIWFLSSRTIR